ncbi:hypothetical protein BCR44DRAFT_1460049 [Catenaria anguillulae PL171]|uniref:Sugar phosphate transporter domain-containing protein n=1 Tax=Catenaria anguillulae PL171 TaxID=765915 RepID=A0A1Y2HTJ3_9FUNG|nr:hypothetical protein BCR44DRAFT_1460049 [Catenaria anguillulae PL171]
MAQLDRAAYMRNAIYIAGWYTASTFLSIYNKQLFGDKYWNFKSPVGASALHNIIQFGLASLVIHVIAPHHFANFRSTFSFTDFQSGYLYYALPTAIGAAADVALSNTSLRYITLPAYIYVKNSTPIFVLLSSWALGLERITPRLIVIILVIFTGVCLAVKGEAVFTPYGMTLAFIASGFSGLRWSLTQLFMKWNARRGSSGGSALTTLYTFTPFMAIVLSMPR